jgi:hypothetical protein
MKKILIGACLFLVSGMLYGGYFWIRKQPVEIIPDEGLVNAPRSKIPDKNKKILAFIELHGQEISPTYYKAVCTEFIIEVLNKFTPLSKQEKKDIRIITNKSLDSLVRKDAPVIRGVQTALVKSGKGIMIEKIEDVLPGDFVQFWEGVSGQQYGHCGVVVSVEPGEYLTLYSSHPSTNGYGKQKYPWPEKLYFVRLK